MRNKIMPIIILLVFILLLVSVVCGIKLGSFQILSLGQLKEKNNQLNSKIDTVSNLTSVDYPENVKTLEQTYSKHTMQKQKYEEIAGFSDDGEHSTYETKKYDISYLWKILGKYATSYNLKISMNLNKKGSGEENLYDLNFDISGQYTNIARFINEIENNSDLGFRIYNFKMSGSGVNLLSSFTIKNVNIDPSSIKESTPISIPGADTTTNTPQATTGTNDVNAQ